MEYRIGHFPGIVTALQVAEVFIFIKVRDILSVEDLLQLRISGHDVGIFKKQDLFERVIKEIFFIVFRVS